MANAGGGCPFCGCRHDSVTKTLTKTIKWQGKELTRIKRRRKCRNCGLSYGSVEIPEEDLEKLIQDSNDYDDVKNGRIQLD